jgi:hypothetical protein
LRNLFGTFCQFGCGVILLWRPGQTRDRHAHPGLVSADAAQQFLDIQNQDNIAFA